MCNKIYGISLLISSLSLVACAGQTLNEDYGKSVERNKVMQVVDLDAPQQSHPDVKMDGQKAEKVVENYRKEAPQADTGGLTQGIVKQ